MSEKFGILVGGGPAPGINSVISAATIQAINAGYEVLGILDGFEWLARGSTKHTTPLTLQSVSRLHFRGGSFVGTSRYNPTKKPGDMENVLKALLDMGITRLITIGGDDTAFTAYNLHKFSKGQVKVAHVPKTIDNDLDLPHGISTFGFQTARHLGVDIVKNIMVDAHTTHRWYFVISMGRKAGHLALGIGKAAGTTITLVPEEFREEKIKLSHVVDILVGAIIKRLSMCRRDGVAVIAEGLGLRLDPDELSELPEIEKDEHDNVRLSELNLGAILKERAQKRLIELGIKTTIVSKDIGYELRCADPIPFDIEYTRDLGYCASQFLIEGGSGAMVSRQEGKFVPIYFDECMDPETGRMKIRMINTDSEMFQIAQKYMLRLTKNDLDNPAKVTALAQSANMDEELFKKTFGYLTE